MEIKIDDNGILYCDGVECILYASNLGCSHNCAIASIAERIQRGKSVDLSGVSPMVTPGENEFEDCNFCCFKGNCKFNPCPLEIGWHFKKITNEKSNNKHRR